MDLKTLQDWKNKILSDLSSLNEATAKTQGALKLINSLIDEEETKLNEKIDTTQQ